MDLTIKRQLNCNKGGTAEDAFVPWIYQWKRKFFIWKQCHHITEEPMSDSTIKFFSNENIPLEMHKARVVQKLQLTPIDQRLLAIREAGNNTFLLKNKDVFLDMLTDSGVNAMSDQQLSAMMIADDSYAGSETFYRLEKVVQEFFNKQFFLPAHQGRACENIIANILIKDKKNTLMNYHFTTTKAHITRCGGKVIEIGNKDMLDVTSNNPFKGNMDINQLKQTIKELGKDQIAFVRLEAGTNLIGGQPLSLKNMEDVAKVCKESGILLVFDASLLADNLYFIKTREEQCHNMSLEEIVHRMSDCMDLIYFSGRKLGCAKGGGIATNNEQLFNQMSTLVTLFEGFLTYGGMSVKEMEAMAVGLKETLDFHMISQTPIFVEAFGNELEKHGVPVVRPFGGLGCHIDAKRFVDHLDPSQYQGASLTSAIYLISGVRGMERGTMSEQRNEDGTEVFADMELVRLAIPKRVFTLSQIKYVADRVGWLYQHRHLIGGLEFVDEPDTLRFFLGKLQPTSDWQEQLVTAFIKEMPNGL